MGVDKQLGGDGSRQGVQNDVNCGEGVRRVHPLTDAADGHAWLEWERLECGQDVGVQGSVSHAASTHRNREGRAENPTALGSEQPPLHTLL